MPILLVFSEKCHNWFGMKTMIYYIVIALDGRANKVLHRRFNTETGLPIRFVCAGWKKMEL